MRWSVPRMWEGGDAWILGGGPSVAKQFGIPEGVVQQVLERISPPSIYSPYMEALHNKHVIGVNISFLLGDWLDMMFFGDNGFFLRYQEQLAKYEGLKITCHSDAGRYSWIKFLDKDRDHPMGISANPSMVSWNGNSGAAAINIAANAGARRIFLLGFDMSLNTNSMQHWHNEYGRGEIVTEEVMKKLKFDRHITCFPSIASDAKKRGIEIINVSPDSRISEFPKVSLKEVL